MDTVWSVKFLSKGFLFLAFHGVYLLNLFYKLTNHKQKNKKLGEKQT